MGLKICPSTPCIVNSGTKADRYGGREKKTAVSTSSPNQDEAQTFSPDIANPIGDPCH